MIAGDLAGTPFLTGVREPLHRRAPPPSTAHLEVVTACLLERAALSGAGTLVVGHLYAPEQMEERAPCSAYDGHVTGVRPSQPESGC